jgi:hypothetical protein
MTPFNKVKKAQAASAAMLLFWVCLLCPQLSAAYTRPRIEGCGIAYVGAFSTNGCISQILLANAAAVPIRLDSSAEAGPVPDPGGGPSVAQSWGRSTASFGRLAIDAFAGPSASVAANGVAYAGYFDNWNFTPRGVISQADFNATIVTLRYGISFAVSGGNYSGASFGITLNDNRKWTAQYLGDGTGSVCGPTGPCLSQVASQLEVSFTIGQVSSFASLETTMGTVLRNGSAQLTAVLQNLSFSRPSAGASFADGAAPGADAVSVNDVFVRSDSGEFRFDATTGQYGYLSAAVPEPGSWALYLSGLFAIASLHWRRRSSR